MNLDGVPGIEIEGDFSQVLVIEVRFPTEVPAATEARGAPPQVSCSQITDPQVCDSTPGCRWRLFLTGPAVCASPRDPARACAESRSQEAPQPERLCAVRQTATGCAETMARSRRQPGSLCAQVSPSSTARLRPPGMRWGRARRLEGRSGCAGGRAAARTALWRSARGRWPSGRCARPRRS